MNKRQIKKRVKRAKLKKENGRIMSLEDKHYMRHYGGYYHTKKEIDGFNNFFVGMPEIFESAVNRVRNELADFFQELADAFRRKEEAE
nr:hypothetical protein [uncultured Trichococcus sp.]